MQRRLVPDLHADRLERAEALRDLPKLRVLLLHDLRTTNERAAYATRCVPPTHKDTSNHITHLLLLRPQLCVRHPRGRLRLGRPISAAAARRLRDGVPAPPQHVRGRPGPELPPCPPHRSDTDAVNGTVSCFFSVPSSLRSRCISVCRRFTSAGVLRVPQAPRQCVHVSVSTPVWAHALADGRRAHVERRRGRLHSLEVRIKLPNRTLQRPEPAPDRRVQLRVPPAPPGVRACLHMKTAGTAEGATPSRPRAHL